MQTVNSASAVLKIFIFSVSVPSQDKKGGIWYVRDS